MKKINEKILLYLSGKLNETDQLKLEQEIQNSPELKKELLYQKERLKELKEISDTSINDFYFRNLSVRVKSRLNPERKKILRYKLVYSMPVLLVLIAVFYFTNRNSDGFEKVITELPESYATSIINEISEENEDIYNQSDLDTTSVENITARLISDNELGEKINSAGISFSTEELNANLSDEELNEIYNEMLKTKLL